MKSINIQTKYKIGDIVDYEYEGRIRKFEVKDVNIYFRDFSTEVETKENPQIVVAVDKGTHVQFKFPIIRYEIETSDIEGLNLPNWQKRAFLLFTEL